MKVKGIKAEGIQAVRKNGKRRTPATMGLFAEVNALDEGLPYTTLSHRSGRPVTFNFNN